MKIRRFFFLLLLVFSPFGSTFSQHIVWEKVFGPYGDDQLTGIIPMEEGFLAIGTSVIWGGQNWSSYGGAIIIKLDENGDTIFVKRLNIAGKTTPYIGHKFGDIYRTIVAARIQIGLGSIGYPAIVEFTSTGTVIQTHILTQYENWEVTNAIPTDDFGLILGGYFIGGLTQQTQMMSIKVNFLGEVEWANKWFPPVSVEGIGRRFFQTKPNEYLITGTLGRRIGGFTFDSTGSQLATKVFYDTPSLYPFITGEATPGNDNSVISGGYYKNGQNIGIGYFGKIDSVGNKIWGGEQTNLFTEMPQANTDGTLWCMVYNFNNQTTTLKKFGSDSSTIKEIPIIVNNGFETIWKSYSSIGNNQVLGVGYKNTQNLSYQFLITKIDSFGTPITTQNQPIVKPPKDYQQVVAFPNPTNQSIQFKYLTLPGNLALYDMKGKKVFEQKIRPEEPVSISNLPKGQYLWHIITDAKKIYSGKILKE